MRLPKITIGFFLYAGLASAADPRTATSSEETVAALVASYQHLSQSHLDPAGTSVVIQRKLKYIVVSFIEPCSLERRCYGGRIHVVYDPSNKKVVYVLGEQ